MSTRRRFLQTMAACCVPWQTGCGEGADSHSAESASRAGFDVWTRYSGAPDRIAELLRPRSVAAKIFKPTLSDEITKIFDKLKRTAQVDPQLFLLLMRDGSVDGMPQYDPRFGITREEYDRLMHGSHMRLKETGDATVQIVAESEGRFRVRGLPGLSELTVDAALQTVLTTYGEVTRPTEFEADVGQHLTGPLVGYRWSESLVAGELRRYRINEITIAQSQVDGAAWFIANIADSIDNRLLVDYFARFDGPQDAA